MDVNERQKRGMDYISEQDKKIHILSKFLMKTELFLKDSGSVVTAKLEKMSPNSEMIFIHTFQPEKFVPGERIILYRMLNRYVHLECLVKEQRGNHNFILDLEKIAIAKKEREFPRLNVPAGQVWITNVITNKARIETNMFNVPTSVKVNFTDYENKLRGTCDSIKIDVFPKEASDKIRAVQKTMKSLLIEDTQSKDCYTEAPTTDFVVFSEEVDDDVELAMKNYKNNKIVSELIIPVIYIDQDDSSIPIGYIQMQSKSTKFDIMKAMEIKTLTFEMVDRIRHSNTISVTDRFPVLDLSQGGLKVKIDHPELIKSLPRLAGFTFDIFFRMQSPLTAYGLIRSIQKDQDGNLVLGISIAGNSSRAGEKKRFIENFNLLKEKMGEGKSEDPIFK